MTNNDRTPAAEFRLHDAVRLLAQQRGVAAGSIGHVLGKFSHPDGPTVVVCFVQDKISSLELWPDEIVLVAEVRTAA